MLLNARALGAGAGARHRHVAALHRRQDDARDPVPAAAERAEAAGQAVHRRDRGPLRRRASARCWCWCSSDRPWGLQPRLAATRAGPAWPMIGLWIFAAMRARRGTSRRSAERSTSRTSSPRRVRLSDGRPVDDRDAGRGAGPSRAAARVRLRRSTCSSRWTSGSLVTPLLLNHDVARGARAGAGDASERAPAPSCSDAGARASSGC